MALDFNELRTELKRTDSQGGGGNYLENFVKMPEGEGSTVVRLLPPRKGDKLYCVNRTHKINGKNHACLQVLVGDKWQGNCPGCNRYKKLWRDSDEVGGDEAKALQAEARAIKPIERYYYNCIVREVVNLNGNKEKDVGPKILSIGKQLHQRILRAILGDPTVDEPELGDVTDEGNGRDLKIIKKLIQSGKEAWPNYDQSKFLAESKLGTSSQISTWMANLHDLQALRKLATTAEMQKEIDISMGLVQPTADIVSSKPVERVVVKPAEDEDTALADDDFIRELRSM